MFDLLEALEEWAMSESQTYRAEGFAAQMREDKIMAATYVGREWAFISIAIKLRELRQTTELATEQLLIPGIVDPLNFPDHYETNTRGLAFELGNTETED